MKTHIPIPDKLTGAVTTAQAANHLRDLYVALAASGATNDEKHRACHDRWKALKPAVVKTTVTK